MEILIDYLTITWKSDKIDFIKEYFNIPSDKLQEGYGTINYRKGLYLSGVNIRWNETKSDFPWQEPVVYETCLELSGKGCRFVELCNTQLSWVDFFSIIHIDLLNQSAHVARIDLALDIKSEDDITNRHGLTAKLVQNYARAGLYISKSKSLPRMVSGREIVTYFGSSKSDRMLRVYDKALEQGIPNSIWTRFELQLRNANALSAVLRILSHNDVGTAYYDELNTFIEFVAPTIKTKSQISNNHGNRLESADWWNDLICGAKAIRMITLPKPEYTLERLERYLYVQPSSSLKTFLIAHDGDLTDYLNHIKDTELNKQQLALIAQLEQLQKEIKEDLT